MCVKNESKIHSHIIQKCKMIPCGIHKEIFFPITYSMLTLWGCQAIDYSRRLVKQFVSPLSPHFLSLPLFSLPLSILFFSPNPSFHIFIYFPLSSTFSFSFSFSPSPFSRFISTLFYLSEFSLTPSLYLHCRSVSSPLPLSPNLRSSTLFHCISSPFGSSTSLTLDP